MSKKQQDEKMPLGFKNTEDPFSVIVRGNLEEVDTMLAAGENPNRTRWSGFSLLHRAAQLGYSDICELLIIYGANVNMKSARGWYTPLHMAMSNGYTETATVLLSKGALPWAKSKYKEDPFDYATKRGFKKVSEEFRAVVVKREMVSLLNRQKERLLGSMKSSVPASPENSSK